MMFMQPMLMTEWDKPFDDERYFFEPILDGQRLQLYLVSGKTRLLTRHGYDVTVQYPELHNIPLRKPADVVLDGEVTYLNPSTGMTEFGTLQERFRMKGVPRIREAKRRIPVVYFVFDILHYNGIDMREKPLTARKRLLDVLLEENAYIKRLGYVEREGIALYEATKQFGMEGIVGKVKRSRYEEGRSVNWVKIAVK